MKFFDDTKTSPAAGVPRPFTSSAKKIDLAKKEETRKPEAWQTAAWVFYDTIGELHFAFNLIGQILSQIRLYVAIIDELESPPIKAEKFVEDFGEEHDLVPKNLKEITAKADQILYDLISNSQGMGSGLMRELGINLSVSGEAYLIQEKTQWTVASTDELKNENGRYSLQRRRSTDMQTKADRLPENTFVARIWRSHPRYSAEADSSMIAVLDSCEQLTLLTQLIRMMTRSRMNAGIVFIPDGLAASVGEEDENPENVTDAVINAALSPLEDESAATSVVPLVLTGPAALGKELKKIELGRPVDEQLVQLAEATLDRILQGVDIPKNIVQGLSDVKFSNAIIIDDNLYRAHIEPLALMIVDALTQVYLRPALRKFFPDEKITAFLNRMVVWFDPSSIVTRPDKSQAANEGFDRNVLSAEAWRAARGFNEHDAPEKDELLDRMALTRTQIPPDITAALIEKLAPEFFAALRSQGQEEAGIPDDVSSLLEGGEGMDELGEMFRSETPPAGTQPTATQEPFEGGDIQPGGTLPPRVSR